MRGLVTEFGLTVPQGVGRLAELKTRVDEDEAFPQTARRVFTALLEQYVTAQVLRAWLVARALRRTGCFRVFSCRGSAETG
jgi:hypothetical protein